MALVKVENHSNLVRDTSSGAILNTDRTGLQEYYRRRDIAKKNFKKKKKLNYDCKKWKKKCKR